MKSKHTCLIGLTTWMVFLLLPSFVAAQNYAERLALQTWTARSMNFDDMTDFAVKAGITDLQLWSSISGGHVNPLAPWAEIERWKKVLDSKGLHAYGFGVTRATKNESQIRKVFEFAKYFGMEMVIVEPGEKHQLDLLEKFAIAYDIKVAVHNHTIDSPYGNPVTVKMLLEDRDPRVGVCLDAGWMTTTRLDVAEVYKEYGDRVFDVHLKDKKVWGSEDGDKYEDVDIGTGHANFKGLFQAMKASGYQGRLAIETDQELDDPTAFVKGAIAFVEKHDN